MNGLTDIHSRYRPACLACSLFLLLGMATGSSSLLASGPAKAVVSDGHGPVPVASGPAKAVVSDGHGPVPVASGPANATMASDNGHAFTAPGPGHEPVASRPGNGLSAARLSGEIFDPALNAIGSPWLVDHWSGGMVRLWDGEEVDGQLLMYNGYLDELIWLHPATHQPVMLDKGLVESFVLFEPVSRKEMHFQKIHFIPATPSASAAVYTQLLYSGGMEFYLRHRVRRTGESIERTAAGRTLRTHLTYTPEYYLVDSEGKAHYLDKFNRRTLGRVFPDYGEEVRLAFRRQVFTPRTAEQRAELIERLDELISGD